MTHTMSPVFGRFDGQEEGTQGETCSGFMTLPQRGHEDAGCVLSDFYRPKKKHCISMALGFFCVWVGYIRMRTIGTDLGLSRRRLSVILRCARSTS
jgi:hypothetical protein